MATPLSKVGGRRNSHGSYDAGGLLGLQNFLCRHRVIAYTLRLAANYAQRRGMLAHLTSTPNERKTSAIEDGGIDNVLAQPDREVLGWKPNRLLALRPIDDLDLISLVTANESAIHQISSLG